MSDQKVRMSERCSHKDVYGNEYIHEKSGASERFVKKDRPPVLGAIGAIAVTVLALLAGSR